MKFKDLLNQQQLQTFKEKVSEEDKALFQSSVGSVKKIHQDKVESYKKPITEHLAKQTHKKTASSKARQSAEFHFSDQYEPYLGESSPIKYVREGADSFMAKRLRRGEYNPDLILDLHGLDQQQAKAEISALLYACEKEHARCVCIVHGLGSRILKNKVPHWLVQHPDVIAFHQAPLEWGGDGALLVLVDLKDKFYKEDF